MTMRIIKGSLGAIAVKHKLGRIISVIPPEVEISEEDVELIMDEYKSAQAKSVESRAAKFAIRKAARSNSDLEVVVNELREQINNLRSQLSGEPGTRLAPEDPFGVGAVWLARCGERMDAGKLRDAGENLVQVATVDATNIGVVNLITGRKSTILRDTLVKNPTRYVCVRPAGARKFHFPKE